MIDELPEIFAIVDKSRTYVQVDTNNGQLEIYETEIGAQYNKPKGYKIARAWIVSESSMQKVIRLQAENERLKSAIEHVCGYWNNGAAPTSMADAMCHMRLTLAEAINPEETEESSSD